MSGAVLTLETVRRVGERLMEDVSREYCLAQAGHKPVAELQPIYARHAAATGDDALALAREAFLGAPAEGDERRAARMLLDWLVDTRANRALAALDEREIAWENAAVVTLEDGRQVAYQRAAIEIANAATRAERLTVDRGRAALVGRELAPLRCERFQRERDYVARLEIADGYLATFAALSGIDLAALAAQCEAFLRDTQAVWDDTVREAVRTKLGIPVADATRADALAMLRGREFDRYFPAAAMEPAVRRQVAEMGIDAEAGGRVSFDTAERAGKRARAFCAPVRIPQEVYLVLRPHGGQVDYRSLLHELGHALHFAYTRADLPFEFRWLGDKSVTEAYAMLFDHLLHDAGWLRRYAELSRHDAPRFLHAVGFEELQFLRRYCAKLLYEVELYGGATPWERLPDLYVERLTAATSFRYDRADAFVDVDPRLYSARYLRAWQLQALLADVLREQFDADWWRNPRAGPWVVGQLFGEGQRELGDELAVRIAGRALSFAPLVRSVEGLLAA